MSSKLKCRICFVVGGKGGVGKSFCIGLAKSWADANGIDVLLYDCDDETSSTSRFQAEARFLAIRSASEIDALIQAAITENYRLILVDLPARAGDEFQNWFSIVPWNELGDLGVRFTAIGVISGAKDSLEAVLRWREFLGEHVDYLIALNHRDSLDIYLSSRSREQFLAAGIREIEIPKLDERFATALDKANWTIDAALQSTEPHFLTQLMSRARLRRYREQVFHQLDQAKSILLP